MKSMRSVHRIDIITEALRKAWHKGPDLRLGQLITNICEMNQVSQALVEDDHMLKLIELEEKQLEKNYIHAKHVCDSGSICPACEAGYTVHPS